MSRRLPLAAARKRASWPAPVRELSVHRHSGAPLSLLHFLALSIVRLFMLANHYDTRQKVQVRLNVQLVTV